MKIEPIRNHYSFEKLSNQYTNFGISINLVKTENIVSESE